jgi:YgiT-type zinc finger domain-containing protein
MSHATKHKFRYREEEYTICITRDDWWLEDGPSDMSERMMKAGEEFALEHGMLTPKELCPTCRKANMVKVTKDYRLESVAKLNGESFVVPNVTRDECHKCGEQLFTMSECEKIEDAVRTEQKKRGLI